MLRLSLLSGLAALALFTVPASADGLKVGGFPLVNQNVGNATNMAVGSHNVAGQKVTGVQVGQPGYGHRYGYTGTNSNIGNATNLAAGVNNTAIQSVTGIQQR